MIVCGNNSHKRTMYFIQFYLLMSSICVHFGLPSDDSNYVDIDDELDWNESNEFNVNTTDMPNIESIDEWKKDVNLIENTTKNVTIDEAIAADARVQELSAVLKSTIHRIRQQFKKMDIIFLIDSSSSVGKSNFRSELRFVIKFLSDFNVSYNYTRVSIVTFSSQQKIVRHVDHISEADADNDKCKLLNLQVPAIDFSGGGTHTADALKQAQSILMKARRHSKKIICLITDGFSNGEDPMPIADTLKADNVTIITFGIQSGNFAELHQLSSDPGNEHSFLLDSFAQFESLARKALHTDYKIGNAVRIKNSSLCDELCDKSQLNETSSSCCDANAACTCSTISGHYSCQCAPGYYGSGLIDNCQFCPNGTYWHSWNLCKPCPDMNHVTSEFPALNASYCVCKSGFKADSNNRCEVLRCPMLQPPENGYFVKHPLGCDRVLNTACGARCKSGYQLIGSSIRLCQDNGTWSGVEAKCILKTCPKLPVPFYGMATCKNADLNLLFDYTPRNDTFMEFYENEELRTTELMPIDTDCKFKCGPGFYMIGSATRNCLPVSKWDGLQTTCKQIVCSGLPEVPFGQYDPTDCTNQKVVHGSNCTLMCTPGFEVKGPTVKSCGGKKLGIWSNRSKLPKCVDVMPPEIICPQNFSVPMVDDDDYAIVKIFPAPNVTDNSDDNITYWLKPSVKDEGVKLTLGCHTFSYIAVDSFRNKAKCNFSVIVLDITPPNIDNCINPPEMFIPSAGNLMDNRTFVDWDAPIIYDNSNIDVNVTQSIYPGHIGIGMHYVEYVAIDSSGNQNTCILNVSVRAMECDSLSSPGNGQSLCAKNETHTWCDVICDLGYTIYVGNDEQTDQMRLLCDNENPQWQHDPLPDCTKVELPDSIEQVFSITLDDDEAICKNDSELSDPMVQNLLTSQIRQQLCEDLDQCEIVSEIPDCNEIIRTNIESDLSDDETTNRNFYAIVKRDTSRTQFISSRNNANMKIKVYTKISKGLGLWNQSLSRAENLDIVRKELKTYHTNDRLRLQLHELHINVKHLNLEENLLCRSGSVLKRSVCVQCPRGTFHNKTLNSCQLCRIGYFNDKEGQAECEQCPSYHSTRKLGAKFVDECIEQCPPGTMARVRLRANQRYQSLMPFCRKCPPAQYQPDYNQIKCLPCPMGMTSPRGAISIENCFEERRHICELNSAICGPHGVCMSENSNLHLYSCLCEDGFSGSHCEQQIDVCGSAPCHNNGQCIQVNSTNFMCKCPDRFTGETCEVEISTCSNDYCSNYGTCIETDRKPVCECAPGYAGELCEIQQNYCSNNPCESGQCQSSANGFLCKCPPGIIGRRCHLRPCDYLPCHENAQCVDLPVLGATRRSYRCVCPKGLKGATCTQVKSACELNPCKNNGICTPFALRNINSLHLNEEIDENIYEVYTCKCPPYFYGINCETFVSPDYVLEFVKPAVHNYVKLNGPVHHLSEISFCTWIQTNDSFNYGTIFSYATEAIDNMFTLTDYNGIVLYVHGKNVITDITLNDGEWHFICATWTSTNGKYDIFIDGNLRDSGYNLSSNSVIEANGTIVVGQEQDSIGSSFSDSESFIGRIAYMDMWNRRLNIDEMFEFYTTCEPYQGNLLTWTDFRSHIYGAVKITRSPFCRRCPQNLVLKNGFIRYLSNRAFHYCADGYKMHGPAIRNCLRTSKWSLPVPYCRSIDCGYLPTLLNGQITMEKSNIGEIARYSCNDNYYLSGPKIRYCLNNSTWSDLQPECISLIQCGQLKAPHNGKLIYANEHGRIAENLPHYPMGTFVEVQCENDTMVKGEGFLSCIDSGTWDYAVPECIAIPTTTSTTIRSTSTSTSSNTSTSTSTTTTVKPTITTTIKRKTTTTIKTTKKATRSTTTTKKTTTTAKPTTTTSQSVEMKTTTMATLRCDTAPIITPTITTTTTKTTAIPNVQPFKVNSLPDKHFWLELKQLYYYGCNNIKTQPNLCQMIKNAANYTDLTQFELPETNDFKHMDQNLLTHLAHAEKILNFHPETELNVQNLLPFILYGKNDSATERMPSTMANAYRFVICLYIDTILLDRNLNMTFVQDPPNDDNITQKLKYLLIRITSKVFEDYSQIVRTQNDIDFTASTTTIKSNAENRNENSGIISNMPVIETTPISSEYDEQINTSIPMMNKTKSTPKRPNNFDMIVEIEAMDETCHLESLPESPPNSFISEIKIDNETLFKMPDRLYLIGPVSIHTRAYLVCKDGFRAVSNSTHYLECSDGMKWIGESIKCEAITCAKPSVLNEFTFSSRNTKSVYYFGQKLQLKCNRGYELKGEPFLQCLESGEWSHNISNCSRISCSRPELLEPAKIVHGNSYLYSDRVVISCGNGRIADIVCKADGQWSEDPSRICSALE